MTVTASKKIRALLKAAGYGKADVSVYNKGYSMGSTVYVTIKRAEIPLGAVEKIAAEGEEIRRDASGDILGGGNCFVDTRYAHELLDDYAAQINAQIDAGRWRFGIFSITNDDRFTLSAWRDDGDGSGSHVLKMDRASPGDGLARLLAREGMLGVIAQTEARPAGCVCSDADGYECLVCERKREGLDAPEPEPLAVGCSRCETPGPGDGSAESALAAGWKDHGHEGYPAWSCPACDAPLAPVVSINTPLARANEVAAEMAAPIERALYSLDEGATGERLAARVVRAAERWQAAFPCPEKDEPRLRALWLAVERLIEHDSD